MSKTLERPTMQLRAYCLDCKRFHDIRTEPGTPLVRELADWENKHRGHRIEFSSPERQIPGDLDDSYFEKIGRAPWWLPGNGEHDFTENTNFQFTQQSAVNMTFTSLDSLASDASLLAGASALAVDNGASAGPLEIGVSGYIKNHSSAPTVDKEIDVYAYAALDDTPTYPDTLLGTDATKTITTAKIINSGLRLITSMKVAATTNQVNPFAPCGLTSLFGVMPRYWSIWVVHNMGQIVNASGNRVAYKGVYIAG